MTQEGINLQEAMDWIGKSFEETSKKFLDGMNSHPPCENEAILKDVIIYKEGIRNWITAALYWSFECGKYFPKEEAAKVMKERKVVLLPKVVEKE